MVIRKTIHRTCSSFDNKLQTFIYDVQLTFLKTLRNINEGL